MISDPSLSPATSLEWQMVFDKLKDGIFILDADQRIVRCNKAAAELFRLVPEQTIGKRCFEIVHGTPSPFADCPFQRTIVSRQRERKEIQVGDRWFEIVADPILDAEQKVAGAVHIVSDVTEQKRAEEKIRESEETYRNLFQNAQVGLFRTRISDGKILESNDQLARMFGYDNREEFIAEYVTSKNYVDPGTRERMVAEIQKNGTIQNFQARFYRKDGSIFWAQYSAKIYPEKGWIEGVAEDITGRKQIEAERERLQTAVQQAGDVIVITDSDGTIQYVNPAFTAVTGYRAEEAVGQNPRILKSGEQNQEFYQELWQTITSGRTWRGRFVNRKKDGIFYTEEASISPVKDATGRIINYVAVKRDITEQLRRSQQQAILQEQFYQAQKMESIGRLAGGVAHDFNNMLNVILGYGESLLHELHPQDPLRKQAQQIVEAAKRSADLTRQLLAFSRKQVLRPEVLQLNEVLRNLENMLRRLIGEDIELVFALAEDTQPILADPSQIEQVILNLAVNARDAMPTGGRLLFETANADLDQAYAKTHAGVAPGKYVCLAVSDTGCGMSSDVMAHIFEPFFSTKGERGTGLGLSTVYGIVKQSGGHIYVYAEPGKAQLLKFISGRLWRTAHPKSKPSSRRPEKGRENTFSWWKMKKSCGN